MFDICLDASYNNHLLLIDRDVVSPPIMINYGGMLKGLHNIIQFGRRNTQFFLWRDFHHDNHICYCLVMRFHKVFSRFSCLTLCFVCSIVRFFAWPSSDIASIVTKLMKIQV